MTELQRRSVAVVPAMDQLQMGAPQIAGTENSSIVRWTNDSAQYKRREALVADIGKDRNEKGLAI